MKFNIDSTTEHIQSTGGIALAAKIAEKTGFFFENDKANQLLNHREILRTIYGLFVQGRSSFEEIKLFRHDSFFKQAFNLKYVSAPETLRLYLEEIFKWKVYVLNKISKCNLNLLNQTKISSIEASGRKYVPVDIDVSPLDNSKSHKEGVSRTYKGHDGYAPIFSYIGERDICLIVNLGPASSTVKKILLSILPGILRKSRNCT